jgi:hypothetical protein
LSKPKVDVRKLVNHVKNWRPEMKKKKVEYVWAVIDRVTKEIETIHTDRSEALCYANTWHKVVKVKITRVSK